MIIHVPAFLARNLHLAMLEHCAERRDRFSGVTARRAARRSR